MANCFETTITNVSGGTLNLPLFGVSALANNGTFKVPGDLSAYIAAKFTGVKARRALNIVHDQINVSKVIEVTADTNGDCTPA